MKNLVLRRGTGLAKQQQGGGAAASGGGGGEEWMVCFGVTRSCTSGPHVSALKAAADELVAEFGPQLLVG